MKKFFLLVLIIIFFPISVVEAKSGCCSGKGGVLKGECYNGHLVCKKLDENGYHIVSPSCECKNDTTTYNEDKANDNLYYGTDEKSAIDDIDDNNFSRSIISDNVGDAINEEDKTHYYGLGVIIVALASGGYFALKQRKN